VAWLRASTAPLSGEDLARRLGCSRAAVWKQIGALRRLGYRIEARRAHGYALAGAPDRLGPAELAPHLAGRWRDIRWLAETDSTQRVARELGRAGAPEGTVVIAEAQTAGRGRLGRTWHSPRGVNLYCSIVLRPPLSPAAAFPPELRERATSLFLATGRRVDRAAVTGRLLAALEARYGRFLEGGFEAVRAEWESYSCLTGTDVRVASAEGEMAGRVLGLDADGALMLARPDGTSTRIVAGEVTVRG